jgi:hypothetical protein
MVAAFAVIAFAQNVAHADPLQISLVLPSQTGVAGGSVIFAGSATNTGATNTNSVLIGSVNGPSVTVPPDFFVTFGFFNTNFLNQVVASGATRGILNMFTVEIPVSATLGQSYSGTFSVNYESIPDINGPLGGTVLLTNTVQWTIRVVGQNTIPEPTTMLLLSTGLAGVAAKVKRRKKQVQ